MNDQPAYTIILGPCRCQGCGLLVWWDGWTWKSKSGLRHVCRLVEVVQS